MSEPASSAPRHQYEAFLRQLPADWDQQEITQLGAVVGGGTPSREVPSFWRGSIPWVTPGEVSGEASKLLHDTQDHISPSGLAGSGANLLPAGSLLVTTRATLGARVINAVPMATNQGFKSIVFKKPEEASYYYHLFEKVKPELVRRASGTTFLEVSGAEFGSIKLPSPSPDEKLKIAQLLDTFDTTIHQTEAIVKKLKLVKEGLLHDLLTRGVDANGELRPCYEQAPELYQESPLGWVPKEWDVIPLLDAAVNITDGTHQAVTTVSSDQGDVPFLFVSCVRDGEVDWDKAACISRRDYQTISKGREPIAGIVLYTAVGSYGHAAEVPELKDFSFQRHIACIYPKKGKVAQGFMPLFLNWEMVRRYADRVALGNAQKTVTLGELSAYPFVCPHPTEQFEIVSRMSAVQQKLCDEVLILKKLKLEKLGLLDDLLTGCVRVTPLLAQ